MPLQDAGFLEQPDGPVDGRDRDVRIDRRRPFVKRLDVRMILALAQHLGDHAPLLRNAQPLVGAQGLDIDLPGHVIQLNRASPSVKGKGAASPLP